MWKGRNGKTCCLRTLKKIFGKGKQMGWVVLLIREGEGRLGQYDLGFPLGINLQKNNYLSLKQKYRNILLLKIIF